MKISNIVEVELTESDIKDAIIDLLINRHTLCNTNDTISISFNSEYTLFANVSITKYNP